MKKYDYLIVGAGLYGATVARTMHESGKRVLVIDKRAHIGGNCFTEEKHGIHIHKYGAHIMHTNNKNVWNFISKFTEINNYTNRVRVNYKGNIYSFPINMNTLNQIYGVINPSEASSLIDSKKIPCKSPSNLKEWTLSQVGPDLYEIFIEGYTKKQWGKPPEELPSSIIKRLPIRFTYNDNYFNDQFQGIPSNGYTKMFERMMSGIELKLNTNFLKNKEYWKSLANKIIYCGKIDEYYDYCFGELEWRSLKFETRELDTNDFQGTAVINYTEEKVPYTRILEHKHFQYTSVLPEQGKSIVTFEYPDNWSRNKEAYYPVRDSNGRSPLYEKYHLFSQSEENIFFKGRLAEYIYRDMCPTIESAMKFCERELSS